MLQRLVRWCCQRLDLPIRSVKLATFRNSRSTWGGAAYYWKGQITVCIGDACHFPTATKRHASGLQESIADRLEALVMVTAHELAHILQRHCKRRGIGSGGGMEAATDWHALPILREFRAQREALIAEWVVPPATEQKQAVPAQEKRAKKAQDDLARWSRKLQLAKTKVRKLTLRVRYYEKMHE